MNVWANCDNCIYDNGDGSYCSDCLATRAPSNWKPSRRYRPPTNADHIRSMTDEELAEFLHDAMLPHAYWLDWLKHPYEEDT